MYINCKQELDAMIAGLAHKMRPDYGVKRVDRDYPGGLLSSELKQLTGNKR